MNYFSLNKKLLTTIGLLSISLVLATSWFRHYEMYFGDTEQNFYVFSSIWVAFAAVDIALILTAIWRIVTFMRGTRKEERYPITVIAITLTIIGILLSIATSMYPITVEVSVTACDTGGMISSGIPECYGEVTNPGLWPSIGVTALGVVLLGLSIYRHQAVRRSGNRQNIRS